MLCQWISSLNFFLLNFDWRRNSSLIKLIKVLRSIWIFFFSFLSSNRFHKIELSISFLLLSRFLFIDFLIYLFKNIRFWVKINLKYFLSNLSFFLVNVDCFILKNLLCNFSHLFFKLQVIIFFNSFYWLF